MVAQRESGLLRPHLFQLRRENLRSPRRMKKGPARAFVIS